jgi:hypothetical protein
METIFIHSLLCLLSLNLKKEGCKYQLLILFEMEEDCEHWLPRIIFTSIIQKGRLWVSTPYTFQDGEKLRALTPYTPIYFYNSKMEIVSISSLYFLRWKKIVNIDSLYFYYFYDSKRKIVNIGFLYFFWDERML